MVDLSHYFGFMLNTRLKTTLLPFNETNRVFLDLMFLPCLNKVIYLYGIDKRRFGEFQCFLLTFMSLVLVLRSMEVSGVNSNDGMALLG